MTGDGRGKGRCVPWAGSRVGTSVDPAEKGDAVSVPLGPCPGCVLGVAGNAFAGSSLAIAIPANPGLIGLQLSVQGYGVDLSGGPCFGQVHLTDTVDFTVQ